MNASIRPMGRVASGTMAQKISADASTRASASQERPEP
jgi:hypothetical protein